MPPTVYFECCGAIYTHVADDSRVRPPRICRDCPRRWPTTLKVYKKPEGIDAGGILRISDLIEIKGAGR